MARMACTEGSSAALGVAGFQALPTTLGITASYFTVNASSCVEALSSVALFFSEEAPKLAAGARGFTMASEGIAG